MKMKKNKFNLQSYVINENDLKDPILLIKNLQLSLGFQKEFLNDFEKKLSSLCEQIEVKNKNPNFIINENEDYIISELIIQLPMIMSQLGIPFSYLFIKQGSIIRNLLFLYYDENDNDIKDIFEVLINILGFSLFNDNIIRLKHDLIELGIIKNKDFSKNLMNFEEYIFENICDKLNQLEELKSIGRDLDNIYKLKDYYNEILNDIKNLPKKIDVTKAHIEFYQELINPLGDYLIQVIKNINENEVKEENYIDNYYINDKGKNYNKENETIIDMPIRERTFFFLKEKIKEDRNQEIEYKNFSLPLNQENGEEIKRQICGFLNSQGGRLYIGINGQKIVKGIVLNYKNRDLLRNYLVNLTYDFYPKCRLDKIFVYFIPIKDTFTEQFIRNLYIIKIVIYPGDPGILYSMTNFGYKSTLRVNDKCIKLNTTEISKEIIKRDELKNNKNINKNIIKDPEPEVNPLDLENSSFDDENSFGNNYFDNNIKKFIKERGPRPKKKKNIKNMVREGTITVKVSNIDERIPVKEINKFFNGCKCASQRFFQEGYGYLNFSNLIDANNCVVYYNGQRIGNKNIRLKIQC